MFVTVILLYKTLNGGSGMSKDVRRSIGGWRSTLLLVNNHHSSSRRRVSLPAAPENCDYVHLAYWMLPSDWSDVFRCQGCRAEILRPRDMRNVSPGCRVDIYKLDLQTKVPENLQSQRRPLLGPSPDWKHLLALSHLRHYAKRTSTPQKVNVKLGLSLALSTRSRP